MPRLPTFVAIILTMLAMIVITNYYLITLDDRINVMQDQINDLDLGYEFALIDHVHDPHSHDYANIDHTHVSHDHDEIIKYQRRLCYVVNLTSRNVMTIARYLNMPIQSYKQTMVIDPDTIEAMEVVAPEEDR